MDKKKRNKIILLIFFILSLLPPIITIVTIPTSESPQDLIVPISNMPFWLHIVVFYILWPQLLSILLVFIFPLIMLPLFLFLKRKIWYNFKDAYIDLGEMQFSSKIYVKRGIYISLLLVGLIITLSGLLNPTQLLTQYSLSTSYYSSNLLFEPDVINGLAYLFLPFIVGIWSVGWAIEDMGLMHYRFPKENQKMLFEIEPVHLKYNGIVKGYAGIASIIFLATVTFVYMSIWPLHILQTLMTILFMMFYSAPAYFIYMRVAQKIFRKMYRKNLKEIKQLSEDSIIFK